MPRFVDLPQIRKPRPEFPLVRPRPPRAASRGGRPLPYRSERARPRLGVPDPELCRGTTIVLGVDDEVGPRRALRMPDVVLGPRTQVDVDGLAALCGPYLG